MIATEKTKRCKSNKFEKRCTFYIFKSEGYHKYVTNFTHRCSGDWLFGPLES